MVKYKAPRPVILLPKKLPLELLRKVINYFHDREIKDICIISRKLLSSGFPFGSIIVSDEKLVYERVTEEELIINCSIVFVDGEMLEVLNKIRGPKIALSSLENTEVLKKVEKLAKIATHYNKLPRLDCGRCKYGTCVGLARAVVEGKGNLQECVVITSKTSLVIKIGNKVVSLNPWVERLYRRIIQDLLEALKGVEIEDSDIIEVSVIKKKS
ncbi:MAG: (Fe-S)-binding protein [Candidatus Njordarchaeales archaeon]